MHQKFHFISGLPRSGSTLLAALLRQNPRFHASMSGPVGGLFNNLIGEMSGRNEFSVFISDRQRKRVLRGLFSNFYEDDLDKDVIFDTNRLWCSKLRALRELLPDARIIACVRHVPWVVDSIERLVRHNAFQPSAIFNFVPGGTVYSRADALVGGDGLVGYAYNAVKEAFFDELARDNLMILQYETLVNTPAYALSAIYDFIGERPFEHDFNNVSFSASEFDIRAGTPGLHDVRPKVAKVERQTVLPPDLFRRFESDAFWREPTLNVRSVRVV